MKIERIYVNHIQNPLGFEIVRPVISWTVTEAAGTHMSWARVLIAEDKDFQKVVYDSGKRSDLNLWHMKPIFSRWRQPDIMSVFWKKMILEMQVKEPDFSKQQKIVLREYGFKHLIRLLIRCL